MALLLPGVGLGADLSAVLSRIVALGLIPDATKPAEPPLKMRIAASSRYSCGRALGRLDADLLALLAYDEAWEKKSIRFLTPQSTSMRQSDEIDTDMLEDVWDAALQQ